MDRHKYTLRDGTTPAVGSKPTGWAFSDAVIQRSCPRCGSSAGFHCESPGGRKVWPPHDDRVVVGPEHRAIGFRPGDWLAAQAQGNHGPIQEDSLQMVQTQHQETQHRSVSELSGSDLDKAVAGLVTAPGTDLEQSREALRHLLSSFIDLHNGWPVRELHEPPAQTIERALKALPEAEWAEFNLPEEVDGRLRDRRHSDGT